MPHSQHISTEGHLDAATNGQLVTPSLSPITEDDNGTRERRRSSESKAMKLSSEKLHDLTTSPDSIPVRPFDEVLPALDEADDEAEWHDAPTIGATGRRQALETEGHASSVNDFPSVAAAPAAATRPSKSSRSMSSPTMQMRPSGSKAPRNKPSLTPIKTDDATFKLSGSKTSSNQTREPSPMPPTLPLPPPSLPTYLHLELSTDRPSPLYIYRSVASDFPYESSQVKFERLINFFTLPKHLEQVLLFGAVACLDAWMYTFTILPLRFLKAALILIRWMGSNAIHEIADILSFVYRGIGRLWQRWRHGANVTTSMPPSVPSSRRTSASESESSKLLAGDASKDEGRSNGHIVMPPPSTRSRKRSSTFHHRRTRSTPSVLLPNHKADLLQGLLIVCSCTILMWFDASRMYHAIRGQAAIKLYVIYNLLEVFDRLFSALGQDVLECLCSKETLERGSDGRSKVLRPMGMFLLALTYNVMHATVLFYQAITLNVAVNSYSNALLTLLMSNQFVEIKGTVFKKFEKENLFQLTCADIVERFQLWLMLSIIALRNIVEVGGLSISLSNALGSNTTPTDSWSTNGSGIPLISGYVIPKAFTILPKWTGEVLGPFIIVLGSEALVDWCKHAYINKFNNVKPRIYGRFLDVLAKDYYSHAFADQNLTKRLGLPVIPLSCLFIRSCMQTYHMFVATHMPLPIPSPATSISLDSETVTSSPATTAALQHIDHIFRRALGRSTFGAGTNAESSIWWSLDDCIAFGTMITVFLAIFLVLLALKLLLGMALLSYARARYKSMKEGERQSVDTQGRRVGGWGAVEVSEDKRRWIYDDDPDALNALHEKERRGRQKAEKGELKLDHVERYSMTSKRIW